MIFLIAASFVLSIILLIFIKQQGEAIKQLKKEIERFYAWRRIFKEVLYYTLKGHKENIESNVKDILFIQLELEGIDEQLEGLTKKRTVKKKLPAKRK